MYEDPEYPDHVREEVECLFCGTRHTVSAPIEMFDSGQPFECVFCNEPECHSVTELDILDDERAEAGSE